MTAFLNDPNFQGADTSFGQIGFQPATGSAVTGAGGVMAAAKDKINNSADQINSLLKSYDPANPASLLVAQQAMANYNLAITVTSSFIKSIEDTTKAVAQHIS